MKGTKKQMHIKELIKKIDIWLIILMTLLTGIGVLAINSATAYNGDNQNVKKQIIFFLVGLVLIIVIMSIDYHVLSNWYWVIYISMIIMLIAVKLFGVICKWCNKVD